MSIYKFFAESDRFACIAPRGPKDRKAFDSLFDSTPKAAKWIPPRVSLDKSQGKLGDFPSLYGNIPVFSEHAWATLEAMLRGSVEALPIVLPVDSRYLAIHVLDVMDALDKGKSELTYFSSGKVMGVDKYAFKTNKLHNKHIFAIPETDGAEVYLSDDFKKAVEQNGLRGIRFKKLV